MGVGSLNSDSYEESKGGLSSELKDDSLGVRVTIVGEELGELFKEPARGIRQKESETSAAVRHDF